jgi:hypothetical protein
MKKFKKVKFAEQDYWRAIDRIDLKELQTEIVMAAKKHIPKILSLNEVLMLIRQYDYLITTSQFLKLVKRYSISFKTGDETIYFDRDELMEFFRCDGRPVPNLMHQLVRSYIKDKQW